MLTIGNDSFPKLWKRRKLALERYGSEQEAKVRDRTTELAVSEAKFRTLVEQSVVGVFMQQDGVFHYANPALVKFLGYDSSWVALASTSSLRKTVTGSVLWPSAWNRPEFLSAP